MSRHPATPPDDGTRADGIPGPTGLPMSRDDLPPPDTKRWVIRRKAEVVAGVRAGLITLDEACARYSLSVDEFLSWQRALEKHGLAGLRATRARPGRAAQKGGISRS